MNIRERLLALAEDEYRDFSTKLMPSVDKSSVIGIRVPYLRALARELRGAPEAAAFILELPHEYFEEYLLHGFLISHVKDFDECIFELDKLLPYLNSWALTDSISPPVLAKNKDKLIAVIDRWLCSQHSYTVRYAILMLMKHYLDDDFRPEYMARAAAVSSDEYYVNMMISWYFATALAKQYDEAIKYLEERRLSPWIHAKTIQKAMESLRIPKAVKNYLKSLK